MAITSKGYTGSVNNVDWAILSDKLGAQFSVFEPAAFRVSTIAGDRAVRVSTGQASGQGIHDVSDSAVTLTGAPVTSGDRWDLVALRRNWSTRTTTLVLLQGGADRIVPALRRNTVGDVVDHPLALVRFTAGQTAAQEIADLRVWTGDGGAFAVDELVLQFLDRLGTNVRVGFTTWARVLDGVGVPQWRMIGGSVEHQAAGRTVPGIEIPNARVSSDPLMKTGQVTDIGVIQFGNQYLAEVAFDAPFPNAILSVQITPIETTNSDGSANTLAPDRPIAVDRVTRTGFRAFVPRNSTLSTRSFMWLAVGR